jgi:hypothetical protein
MSHARKPVLLLSGAAIFLLLCSSLIFEPVRHQTRRLAAAVAETITSHQRARPIISIADGAPSSFDRAPRGTRKQTQASRSSSATTRTAIANDAFRKTTGHQVDISETTQSLAPFANGVNRIHGQVVDLENTAVPAASVELFLAAPDSTGSRKLAAVHSDSSGTFTLLIPADTDLVLSATKAAVGSSLPRKLPQDASALARPFVLVLRDSATSTTTFAEAMLLHPKSSTLVGRVIDQQSRQPVRDFQVVYKNGGRLTKGNGSGEFLLEDLQAGHSYEVYIQPTGYAPLKSSFVAPPDEETFEHEFEANVGGGISGRTVNKEGQPVAAVRLTLWPEAFTFGQRLTADSQAVTGTDGRFQLSHVPAAMNTLLVNPPPPYASRNFLKVSPAVNSVADLGDIVLDSGSTILLTVLRADGTAVPKATVECRVWRTWELVGTGTTSDDGKCTFPGLPNADSLLVAAPALQLQTTLDLQLDETREVTLREGTGAVHGTVTQHGRGVHAYVTVSRGDPNSPDHDWKTFHSEMSGAYSVSGLSPGPWQVQAVIPDHGEQTTIKYTTIAEHVDTQLDLEIPGASIHGRVLDDTDKPVYAAQVFVTSNWNDGNPLAGDTGVSSLTNSDGEYLLDGLEPGTYSLSASHASEGSSLKQNVVLTEANEAREVLLRLSRQGTGTVISTVLDGQGKPLQRAECLLLAPDEIPYAYSEKRDAYGVLEIHHVPAGNYQVIVSASDSVRSQHKVTVEANKTLRLDDVLDPGGSLKWTLRSADGLPLSGVQCITRPVDGESIEAPRERLTDRWGVLYENGLRPGEYTVTAQPEGRAPVTEIFLVSSSGNFGPNDRKETIVPVSR